MTFDHPSYLLDEQVELLGDLPAGVPSHHCHTPQVGVACQAGDAAPGERLLHLGGNHQSTATKKEVEEEQEEQKGEDEEEAAAPCWAPSQNSKVSLFSNKHKSHL